MNESSSTMARQNGFRYEISWEKDESDANLQYDKLTAYVPGVTHLGKKDHKPLRSKPHKSTQSSSKHPKGPMMTPPKVGHDVKGQEVSKGEDTVSLKNLRPQDKKRIANLIKELAKVGEEKEVAMQQLTVERKEFEVKYINLQTQMNSLKTERESLQHQYLQCQKLLLECQKRLGREQTKHQQYLKSGKGHEKDHMHNKSLLGESKLQNQYFEPVVQDRNKEQFQPQMQSTARVLRGPEFFTHPMNNHNMPTNQQASVHQTMNNHEMPSSHYAQHGHPIHPDRYSSLGKRDPHQGNSRAARQFQEPGSSTGKIHSKERDANLLSPSIFSPDEFHPLPEELINAKSFEAVETGHFKSPSVPRADYEPERLQTQTGGPSLRREDQVTSNYVKGKRYHPRTEESRHQREDVHKESKGDDDTSYGYQRERPANFPPVNQQHPEYETENSEWVDRGREGQSSSRSFHSQYREDSLQRKGPISEMMVQRQRQLEEQKMLLKREQDWLQKQLQDQEELLYQKQMELEAHRDSILVEEDSVHVGHHAGGGASKVQGRTFHGKSGGRRQDVSMERHRKKYNHTMEVGPDFWNTTMTGERIPHHPLPGGEPGPSSHRTDVQQHVEKGGDVTHDKVGSRDRDLVHGSVSLHEDSHHRRYPPGPSSNTTVDASTSLLRVPQQQNKKRSVGLSPAIHHPHSHLLEESSADSSPVWSPDKKFPTMTDHKVEAIPVKDSRFLDDLIEELNSLPSESSNGPDTIIHPAAPIRTLPEYNRSGLSSFHKTHHKTNTLSTSYSIHLHGSEIVSSTDEEDESQLLDDIFFLN